MSTTVIPDGKPSVASGFLATPITYLKGVGPRLAVRLRKLGVETVQDLLFHLPARYQDRTKIVPIGTVRPGDEAVVRGEVLHSEVRRGRRPVLLCRISDGTGSLTLRFFHFSVKQQESLVRGRLLRCFGEVRRGASTLEIIHPEYKVSEREATENGEQYLTPVYPSTEGLHQLTLRSLTDRVLERLDTGTGLQEWLPPEILQPLRLPSLVEALRYVHRPPPDAPVEQLLAGRHPAQRRLAFEELLAHHLSLRRLHARVERHRAPALTTAGALFDELLGHLPFQLTGAQRRVIAEIRADLGRSHPMQRLVQGDVGSGKTLVAAAAVLQAVEAGYQAVVMAPTELLAEQHLKNFSAWLAPLQVRIGWLAGKLGVKARRVMLGDLAAGDLAVMVGTHALFQSEVAFKRLGLIVIDEQHRFGVHQRLALWEKGNDKGQYPHQLIMTATPIPRTLAMAAYADLDCSVIDELPPGRRPVDTVVVQENRRDQVVQRIRAACGQGQQAYWVCTLIEESEALQCQAAAETADQLTTALPELRVGLLHGRMKGPEKEQIMIAFKAGDLDLLVATTVIEVGLDVPTASLMVIENAERLGLAQLHQLRGRVGRGTQHSSCVLMYRPPLSAQGRERLAVMRRSNDGFEIARRDLELRGPGEVLGTRQSGMLQLRIADLLRDQALIPTVERAAAVMLARHPQCVAPLIRRWLGQGIQFGDV
ncbi:MAG: ATP-dependent DNA helicase RecG [Gammaproteobacteria bacterium]